MDWRQILKTRLRAKRITLSQVAEATNVTTGAVSHWLVGRNEPPIKAIKIMAEMAGVAMNELFGDDSKYLLVDEEEIKIVELLRTIPDEQAKTVLMMLRALASSADSPAENTP